MAEQDGQEKSEQPTGKRLSEARDKGQVAKSVELNSFAIFTSGLLILYFAQQFISGQISQFTIHIFGSLDTLTITRNMMQAYAKDGFFFFIWTITPILGGLLVIAIVASVGQIGFHVSLKALEFKLSKFNIIKGVKKLFFSSSSLMEVVKSLLKLIVVGGFCYLIIADFIKDSANLMSLSIEDIVETMIQAAYTFVWKVALLYAIIAAIDFIFQKRKHKKDLMMTKQEVKEETKQHEGDPLVKSRIRRVQMESAKKRMMQDVPKADVIITNPTHYAIAVRYEMNKDSAPKVVAKGVDEVAKRIKEIAVENNIPLHEDRELARALYKMCDIGDSIPSSLFKAVAQILAYVFQLKNYDNKKSIV